MCVVGRTEEKWAPVPGLGMSTELRMGGTLVLGREDGGGQKLSFWDLEQSSWGC